ncbi:MAG: VOC family protein [Crocinitomicaceae bacterium]
MKKSIYPCLWFDGNAKEAAEFYCSIFPKSEIVSENPMVVHFDVDGQRFMCLNGGPMYQFSPATSFVLTCETQDEIDHYWDKLGKGGKYNQCGWLDDQFGVTWQVVPEILGKLMSDPARSPRVVQAFLKMTKFDIQTLLNA